MQGLATPTDIPSRRMIRSLERNTHEHLSEHGVELKPLLLGAGFHTSEFAFQAIDVCVECELKQNTFYHKQGKGVAHRTNGEVRAFYHRA